MKLVINRTTIAYTFVGSRAGMLIGAFPGGLLFFLMLLLGDKEIPISDDLQYILVYALTGFWILVTVLFSIKGYREGLAKSQQKRD